MDLSKLPRMSKTTAPGSAPSSPPGTDTPAPAAAPPRAVAAATEYEPQPEPLWGMWAEIWFMTLLGLVLIMFGKDVIRYEWATLRHQEFHTEIKWEGGEKDGQEIEYPELWGFVGIPGGKMDTDLSLVLLGAMLIVDVAGRAIATRLKTPARFPILGLVMLITVFVVGYNMVVAVRCFKANALPTISILAIAVGGFFVMLQAALFQSLLRQQRSLPRSTGA